MIENVQRVFIFKNLSTNKSARIPQRCIPQVPFLWKWRWVAISGHVIFHFFKNLHVDREWLTEFKNVQASAKRAPLWRVPFCPITPHLYSLFALRKRVSTLSFSSKLQKILFYILFCVSHNCYPSTSWIFIIYFSKSILFTQLCN